MVLEWLSRLLSGFSSLLGGSNPSSVWGFGRGSVSENIFQNQQLEKFTPSYTYQENMSNVLGFLDNLSNFSHAEQAVERINQQRQVNLDFIESEIETLRGITIPTPQFTSYERVGKRPLAGEVAGRPFSYGSGGGVRRRYWINPINYERYQNEIAQFSAYKTSAINTINTQIEKLTQRSNLITSRDKFSL